MPDDTSSTMAYQRDSVKDFLAYFFKFISVGVINTIFYLFSRKRKKLGNRLTAGEYIYLAFCIAMCFVNLKATMLVFIVPLLFARLVMMLGNWAQHSFIDANDPENLYTSSINCINTVYNHKCWNDGYHIVHHLRPGMHYTEMPDEFLKRKDEFAKNKAIVFDGIHYLHIFTWLLTKRYDKLADNLVNINGNMFRSKEEAIALMKERTRKINMPLPPKGNLGQLFIIAFSKFYRKILLCLPPFGSLGVACCVAHFGSGNTDEQIQIISYYFPVSFNRIKFLNSLLLINS